MSSTSTKDIIKHSLTVFIVLVACITLWAIIYLIWFYEAPGNKNRDEYQIDNAGQLIEKNNETIDKIDSEIDNILTDIEILEGLIND